MRKLDRDDEALPGHDLRWLDPSETEISLDDHGSLRVRIGDRTWTNVVAIDCFPIARPGEFLSLRHREDAEHTTELGLLQQPNRWPLPQRRLLEAALEARDLWHRVRHVYGVDP